MYDIDFYEDSKGNKPVKEYIDGLKQKAAINKDSRINLNKIVAYMDILCEHGTRIGEPVVKHIDGEIWELRPLSNRIMFAYYKNNVFLLLHHFIKKTRKTPPSEIKQAKRNLADYLERKGK
ncbi:MAG: type II toxin-antitoxin system RelE/ParE family toxin [Oscillospiraceae bacterium]|nr:type II toxin-antitoxin system RelE/ParE family toxin [Oscillospiraceae bacterium]